MARHSSRSAASSFSFINNENVKNFVKIQEAQFQEYIQLYGIDCEYYSRNLDYYDRNGNIRNLIKDGKYNSEIRDFTYFHGPERSDFGIMMPIKFAVDYGQDTFMFSAFGADASNDAKIYVTKKQFTANCLEFFGLPKNVDIVITKEFEVVNERIACDVELNLPFVVENDLTYSLKVKLNNLDNINVGDVFDYSVITGINFPVSTINPGSSSVVDANWFAEIDEGSFSAEVIESDIIKRGQRRGSGKITVQFKFNLSYNSFKTNYNPHWDTLDAVLNPYTGQTVPVTFAPKVGDIVRIKLVDDSEVFRDYVITFVNDINLSKDGISPLLTNFIWECNIVRRKPSYEDIEVEGKDQMENGLETIVHKSEQEKVQIITREEEVFDYDQEFDDVNDMIIDNIDSHKDGVFGSLNWIDEEDKDDYVPPPSPGSAFGVYDSPELRAEDGEFVWTIDLEKDYDKTPIIQLTDKDGNIINVDVEFDPDEDPQKLVVKIPSGGEDILPEGEYTVVVLNPDDVSTVKNLYIENFKNPKVTTIANNHFVWEIELGQEYAFPPILQLECSNGNIAEANIVFDKSSEQQKVYVSIWAGKSYYLAENRFELTVLGELKSGDKNDVVMESVKNDRVTTIDENNHFVWTVELENYYEFCPIIKITDAAGKCVKVDRTFNYHASQKHSVDIRIYAGDEYALARNQYEVTVIGLSW